MLGPLDDTLWHQLPTTFDHVGTSDPRFFDRYWFAVTEPGGAASLQFTLGVYNNMDVVDGGFVVVHGARQRNLRVSRSLRPRFEPVCGPMRVEVVEPLRRFRLIAEPGDHPVHGELEWVATLPPEEEHPHFRRARRPRRGGVPALQPGGGVLGPARRRGHAPRRRAVVGLP